MIYLALLFFFIPFLFLFYMAIEIFRRNPSNLLHQITMCLILSFGLLFLGDFFANALPLEQAYLGIRVKLFGAFCIMSFGLYFFNMLNSAVLKPRVIIPIALLPLLVGLPVVFTLPDFQFIWTEGEYFRRERHSGFGLLVIYATAAISMLGFIFQLAIGYAKSTSKGFNTKEKQRIGLILRGGIISCSWVVLSEILKPLIKSDTMLPLVALTSYAVLIFAIFIRHAMMGYDFLSTATRRYEILFNLSSNGIFLLGARGELVEINDSGMKMIGLEPGDTTWKRRQITDFVILSNVEEREQMMKAISSKSLIHMELELYNRLGQKFLMETKTDYIEVEGRLWTYITATDITLKKEYEQSLLDMAYHDSLTGLINRRRFYELLQQTIEVRSSKGKPFSVLLVDLDRFKWVNDTLGHEAGDELLVTIASRLKHSCPSTAYVARTGGDEFVILLKDMSVKEEVCPIVNKVKEELNRPVWLNHMDYEITGSIGVRLVNESNPDIETIMRDVDKAMYAAKQAGRNCYHIFNGETDMAKNP